jgi:hypothetical protein
MDELNILGVRQSLIGDKVKRGISGGEVRCYSHEE